MRAEEDPIADDVIPERLVDVCCVVVLLVLEIVIMNGHVLTHDLGHRRVFHLLALLGFIFALGAPVAHSPGRMPAGDGPACH